MYSCNTDTERACKTNTRFFYACMRVCTDAYGK
jgi:hypothetical protein